MNTNNTENPQKEQEMTAIEIKDMAAKESGYKDFSHFLECFKDNVSYSADFDNIIGKITNGFHKQQLSKVLREAGKELPTITDLQNEFINYPNRTQMVSEIMLKMDKASKIIARLQEEKENISSANQKQSDKILLLESKVQSQSYKIIKLDTTISEKDNLIKEREEEIAALKWYNEQAMRNKSARESTDSDYDN